MSAIWYDDEPVIGAMDAVQAALKLRELGEDETATVLTAEASHSAKAFGLADIFHRDPRPWQHTAHAFGYIEPSVAGGGNAPIRHAGNIDGDPNLRGARISITLDQLRVAEYPGGGIHRILFDFYGQNQVPADVEHLHFNTTYRVREGEAAASVGYPIFVGLNVGSEGVALRCRTVNVANEADETMLALMESDVVKSGLRLVATAQPAIAPLSGMAVALTKSLMKRHQNVSVQDFYLGLDFSSVATRARLREGSYIAVQIPQSFQLAWDWEDWVYHPGSGQIVARDDHQRLIPYNYVVLGISEHRDL